MMLNKLLGFYFDISAEKGQYRRPPAWEAVTLNDGFFQQSIGDPLAPF